MTTETQAQANFEMLSQREASDKISVKLGFCDRSPQTLSLASTIVMRTLEDELAPISPGHLGLTKEA